MKFLRKFDNPFVLAANGFVLGAILFGMSSPDITSKAKAPIQALLSVTSLG